MDLRVEQGQRHADQLGDLFSYPAKKRRIRILSVKAVNLRD